MTGDLLRYDGDAWIGVTAGEVLADASLGDLGDVDASDATPGYVLTREADGSFALHAVGGGSASTKVFDGASDGGDTYTLSPEPQSTVLVWVDGLLETDYSVAGATLTFGTAPTNGAAIVAWDIGGGGAPYDIGVYFPGQPEAGAVLLQLVASRPFTLPADLTDSQGYAGTAPTAQADLDVRKNSASIGTITFAAAASTATFTFASEVAFAAGDRLTLLAPGSQDASLRRHLDHLQGHEELTMAWGSKITARQLTSITTEQVFDQAPTLNPRESAHCRVVVDFPASPTDDAVISVYGSLDGTAWSATPLMALVLDKDIDPNSIDFIVTGVYQFRVGVKRSGSTDTLASADLAFRKDGVSV